MQPVFPPCPLCSGTLLPYSDVSIGLSNRECIVIAGWICSYNTETVTTGDKCNYKLSV